MPKPTLPPAEIAALVERGDRFFATGDIASARLFYERAAEQGDGRAARNMARTFDPLVLQQAPVRGVVGNAAKAAAWYRKAIAANDSEAAEWLKALLAKYPQ